MMAFSRNRAVFEGFRAKKEQKYSNVAQVLNFRDSDGEGDETDSVQDESMNSNRSNTSHPDDSWDSPDSDNEFPLSLQTPASPKPTRSLRSLRMRRPKLGFDDVMDCQPVPENLVEAMSSPMSDSSSKMTPPSPCPWTPPHKKLRALRLFDTPHTPKSLLEKAGNRTGNGGTTGTAGTDSAKRSSLFNSIKTPADARNGNTSMDSDRPQANVNPFTPNNNNIISVLQSGSKRSRSGTPGSVVDDFINEDMEEEMPSSKKIALREINTSRYNEEFFEMCKLGDGEFGSVYKCVNRLDGCIYAIKKSKMPVAGSAYERSAMNEVYAHAVLGKHPHVVRYYSAWAENDHMYIQNEYCNGGSLAEVLTEQYKRDEFYSEPELCQILYQLAKGLKYIHSQHLVHLDIKPGNIFIHKNEKITNSPESGVETGEDDDDDHEPDVLYKIGDLGHVTSMGNTRVEEGDCRYLPRELLAEEYDHLSKADVFSLALTMWHTAGGGDLPKNGDEWHIIRDGSLPNLTRYSKEFNQILKKMIDPDPTLRPSASTVMQHHLLCPYGSQSRAQLRRELNEEKFKNQMLSRKLIEATERQMQSLQPGNNKNSRLIGRKTNRSMSLTVF